MKKIGWTTIVLMILIGYDELTENISKLAKLIGIPIKLLLIIAIIFLFVYWAYFLLRKIIKIYKKHRKINIIPAKFPKDYEPLPIIEEDNLPKQSIEILKLLRNGNQLHSFEIKDKLSFTVDELSYNTRFLWLDEGYIEKEELLRSELPIHLRDTDHSFKWKLTHKGIAYIIENHL